VSSHVPLPTGGGTFDPNGSCEYFLAANLTSLQQIVNNGYGHVLIAVNEVPEGDLDAVAALADSGAKVMLDSGIFNLANNHAKRHGITLSESIGLAPEQLDGFVELRKRYVVTVKRLHAKLWGFVEMDQGGMLHKRRIRQELEDELGVSPIPVYHPFNDGWDYFDELAEGYDRLCVGNLVQTSQHDRKRLVATMWERRRRHPHVWIHLLGFTPNHWLLGLPLDSCDSSTWLGAMHYAAGQSDQASLRTMGSLQPEFRYKIDSDPESDTGHKKARLLASAVCWSTMRNWQHHRAAMRQLGEPDCPPLTPRREKSRLR
jgi:hypothetical protein